MDRMNLDKTRLAIFAFILGATSIGCAPTAPATRARPPRPASIERTESKHEPLSRRAERSAAPEISPVAADFAVKDRTEQTVANQSHASVPSAPTPQCAPGSGAAVHLRVTRDRGVTMVGPLRRVVAPVCRIERLDVIDAVSDESYVPGANGFTSLFRLDW